MADQADVTLPDLLTVSQAAKLLHRRPDTLHRWIKDGALPAVTVGKTRFIKASDLRAMLGVTQEAEAAVQSHVDAGEPILTDAQLSMVRGAILDALDTLARVRRVG